MAEQQIDLAQQATGGNQSLCVDARGALKHLVARAQRHDNLFQRAVPSAFTDAVDRSSITLRPVPI